MPSDPCYDVGDRLLLHSEHSGPVEVIYRGCADGRAVVLLNGYQFAVDPRRLSAPPTSPDEEDDL